MPRGRNSRAAAPVRRAVAEALEVRQLLTTLSARDGVPAFFDYYDAAKNTIRIEVVGNITAEFTGARVTGTNGVVIRDLVSPPPPNSTVQPDGVNLFNIYVAAADKDAQIIITKMKQTTLGLIPDTYTGDGGSLRYINTTTGRTVLAPLGSNGSVYIGARTIVPPNSTATDVGNVPITFAPYRQALGVRPATRGIFAGLQTAPGVSLGKVLIDGTVTGIVNVAGSLGTWYSSYALTGDATGAGTVIKNNFQVGGDLRNLLVRNSVGTIVGEKYATGSQLRVGGKIGYEQVGGNLNASVSVINSGAVPALTTPVQEIESLLQPSQTVGDAFLTGDLAGDFFSNDTYAGTSTKANQYSTVQFASTYTSSATGAAQSVEFEGAMDSTAGDSQDNYAVSLIAGQKIGVYLNSLLSASVAIYNPLGQFVSSDFPDHYGAGNNVPFQFTAKLPGVYRFSITLDSGLTASDYTLNLSNVGNVSLGGAEIGGTTSLNQAGTGVSIRSGDLGAWVDGGNFDAVTGAPVSVQRGNLRALYAANIGEKITAVELYPDLIVPAGTVGSLLATGNIIVNPLAENADGDPVPAQAIGNDYQRVEAGGNMDSNLVANGSIGTVIANVIASGSPSFVPLISANTRGGRNRGTIDMLYTTGNFGSTSSGGPGLYTGLGGNVKYLHVGGKTFPDRFFGGNISAVTTYPVGQSINLVDDSGARVTVVPVPYVTTTTGTGTGTGSGTTSNSQPGRLSAILYGVRESGGNVTVDISSTTGITINGLNNGGSFDVGHIGVYSTATQNGTEAIYDETSRAVGFRNTATGTTTGGTTGGTTAATTLTPANKATVSLTGRAPINVLGIDGTTQGIGLNGSNSLTNLTSVVNSTPGEIATLNVNSVGTLQAQSVGVIKSDTVTPVVIPSNLFGTHNIFPFDAYSTGIDIISSVINISSREAIGNVYAGGAIGSIVANSDARNASGIYEGVVGDVVTNVLQSARIGEGIPSAGTGSNPTAGLFAFTAGFLGEIDNVTGTNADIRGVVASEGIIGAIRLQNGSLIGAEVSTPTELSQTAFTNNAFTLSEESLTQTTTSGTNTNATPVTTTLYAYSLNSIHILGTGGIIGSAIFAGTIGAIDVTGFGILSSLIESTTGSKPSGSISAAGFGIRESLIDAGNSIGNISAVGDGSVLSVANYSPSVRQSETVKFDPFTGRQLSYDSDLNRFFGTTRAKPAASGVTNSGLLVNDVIVGDGNLNSLSAYAILGGTAGDLTSTNSSSFPMRVAFANSINLIKTASAISGLQVRTGKLNTFTSGGSMDRVAVTVSGAIGTVAVGRTMRGSVAITARGPQGTIGTIYARNSLYGTFTSSKDIKTIRTAYFGGNVQTSQGIGTITISADILSTGYIRAQNDIGTLFVGGSINAGATVQARSIGTEHVGGVISGAVIRTA